MVSGWVDMVLVLAQSIWVLFCMNMFWVLVSKVLEWECMELEWVCMGLEWVCKEPA